MKKFLLSIVLLLSLGMLVGCNPLSFLEGETTAENSGYAGKTYMLEYTENQIGIDKEFNSVDLKIGKLTAGTGNIIHYDDGKSNTEIVFQNKGKYAMKITTVKDDIEYAMIAIRDIDEKDNTSFFVGMFGLDNQVLDEILITRSTWIGSLSACLSGNQKDREKMYQYVMNQTLEVKRNLK